MKNKIFIFTIIFFLTLNLGIAFADDDSSEKFYPEFNVTTISNKEEFANGEFFNEDGKSSRLLFDLNLSNLPSNIDISHVYLNLDTELCNGDSVEFSIGRTLTDWNKETSWTRKPGFSYPTSNQAFTCDNKILTFEIRDLIEYLINNSEENFGFTLYGPSGEGSLSYFRLINLDSDLTKIEVVYKINSSEQTEEQTQQTNPTLIIIGIAIITVLIILISILIFVLINNKKVSKNTPEDKKEDDLKDADDKLTNIDFENSLINNQTSNEEITEQQ